MSITPGLVSVVIINFNSAQYISRCIATLEQQTYRPIEIIIVDNGSTDSSVLAVKQMRDDGRVLLFTGNNVGSSKANNRGIRESHGEYILILNADAFPAGEYIEKCVAAFKCNNEIGTVVGKLVSDSNTSIIDSAGIYFFREGLPVDRGFGEADRGQYDTQEYIDGACCAAALYSRKMLEDICLDGEYYDEDFFAFAEDPELSLHSGIRGWRTLYVPTAVVRHVRGGSTATMSEFAYHLNERNMRLMLRKGFSLVARPSDRILQKIVLAARRIKEDKTLSPELRRRLNSEEAELGLKMDQKRGRLLAPNRRSAFSMQNRRSYLVAMILRRIGIARHNRLSRKSAPN
jgi:GT2 family glycosyltransferase